MLIGITGQIGTGKTEVAAIFKKYGAYIISADRIGRQVVEKDLSVLKKLINVFGREILSRDGKLNRRKLGEIVFADGRQKKKLNKIVHPMLLRELACQAAEAQKKERLVVIDAALLIDWGWDKKVDFTLLVHSRDDIKIDRLVEKGYSRKEARMRIKSQLSFSELKRHADYVIFNNGSIDFLRTKVEKIVGKLI